MSRSDRFWDKSAAKYANSPVADEATYQRKLQETQSLFSSGMKVLEFGCGTGTTAIHHASHVSHIDAIDISENMLQIATDKATAAGVNNIHFHRGTLTDFDAAPSSYDVILGLSILHLVPNLQETLAKVSELLKPGGYFVSSTACLGDSYIKYIKLISPVAKLFGLMPDVLILTEQGLISDIENSGIQVDTHWHHGDVAKVAFIIGSKPT